ncbi:MAG: phosphoglycerate dehydrogenase [Hyphomicrobiaceae bacterium]
MVRTPAPENVATPRVLIADELSPQAVEIFAANGIAADIRTGLSKEELLATAPDYDGIAVRSATKITDKVLAATSRLKVVGRAGIGVDNIDVKAATAKGVIVMNTPFGNSVTTAEHAITLMLALARQIPAADRSTQAGRWEKSRFVGVEIAGKTLGVIGCGNIGAIVADRAVGLKMHVVAFDPFLSPERAAELKVEKVELDELLRRSDFITLHTPLTDKTRNIIDAAAIRKTKKSVRIINCARGGLVVEEALRDALASGHVAGAALDVYAVEPAKDNPLFGMDNVICTPHLGASTTEAQEKVAVQIAEQMCSYLLKGAITNAINFPSISAEEAPKLRPFVKLAEQLGSFAGQMTESGLKKVEIEYVGEVADLNTRALTAAALSGLLAPLLEGANMVSAPALAKDRGIGVAETKRTQEGAYGTYVRLTVVTETQARSIAGTVFSGGRPRLIQIKGINMEAELTPHMLYITNRDKPGFIGALGTLLGQAGVNIASFNLGRTERGGEAIALVEIDEELPDAALAKVRGLPHVVKAHKLRF